MKTLPLFLLVPFLVLAGDKLTVELSTRQVSGYSGGPLRLLFSEPMIPLGFPTDSVPKGLSLTPPVRGKWTWGSQSTLLFTPDSSWRGGVVFTVTIPAGIESRISQSRLKKPFVKKFTAGSFYGSFPQVSHLRPTIDFVNVWFTLPVHPDSLRRHLSGAPKSLEYVTNDQRDYLLRPHGGWAGGKRFTLSIDAGLTPLGGDMPLESALSTAFTVSDTLACLGLFRDDKEVSASDTLFLEDHYDLQFNRQLRRKALRDYFTVNGKPADIGESGDRIRVNQFLKPCNPCTLSFNAGMPSEDNAFLFHDMRFVLVGDYNRIDPGLPAFSITSVIAHWGIRDSAVTVSLKKAIDIKPTLKFELAFDKTDKQAVRRSEGRICCFTQTGIDTLEGSFDSVLYVRPRRLPAHSLCTLVVKAGYRAGDRQLKKDFSVIFRTGKIIFPNTCRPVWGKEYDGTGNYEYDDEHDNESYDEYDNGVNDDASTIGRSDGRDITADDNDNEGNGHERSDEDSEEFIQTENNRPFHPIINLFPESPSVPVKRFGSPRVIAGVRSVRAREAISQRRSAGSASHRWRFDTMPGPSEKVTWYEYVPIRLAPSLSKQGRGIVDVMLSVNGAAFDTLGRYQTTDLGLQLMRGRLVTAVSVTSLTKRTPVAGASIALIGKKGAMLAQGQTDDAGLFRIRRSVCPEFVIAAFQGDTLVYETKPGKPIPDDTLRCYGAILTDRDLYRAGDTVFFKGIARRLQDRWEPAPTDTAIVTIQWKGAKPFIDTLPLFGCGSFSGSLVVPDGASRQPYGIQAKLRRAKGRIAAGLTISDFRPMELSVNVGNGSVEGAAVRFPVSAKWLHGGQAGLCSLSWSCRMRRNWDNILSEHFKWNGRKRPSHDRTASGNFVLDKTGRAVINVPFLPEDSGSACDFSVTVAASAVQSAQAKGRARTPFSKRLCIGFSQHRDGSENDTVILHFKAMRENGDTCKGVKLRADISRQDIVKKTGKNRCGLPAIAWDTVRSPVRTDYATTDLRGIAVLQMASVPAGRYFAAITPQGQSRQESFIYEFFVFEPDTGRRHPEEVVDENHDDRDEFSIAEKDSCVHRAGDTVRLRLTASRDSCRVLLTLTRENLYEHRWITMTGRDTVLSVVIREEYIPIVAVRASFFPPVRRNGRGLASIRHGLMKTKFLDLHVSDESRTIAVQVTTDRASYAPGDSVTVHCTVFPKFSSAAALVMAVDEGVLQRQSASLSSITGSFSMDFVGVNRFATECSFRRIRAPFDYDSLNGLREPNEFGIGFGAGYGSGFGGGSGMVDDIIGGLLGGDGGGGLTLKMGDNGGGIRNPPRPCAYFNPHVTFDKAGEAICRFKLPGNLTRWRVTVVVDDTTCFGENTASFTASRQLMIRPQLPQFLRLGDSASAVYMLENRSGAKRTIVSEVTTKSDTATGESNLSIDETRQCRFPFIGRAVGEDSLLFFTRSDSLSDGIKLSIPVIFERPRDAAAIGGSTLDSATIPVLLPNPEKIDSGSLEISLSTTRMQNLREGIRYLFEYPYGCLEQKGSAIMPLLVLSDFTKRFDLPMLRKGDEKQVVQKYLNGIVDFQNDSSGGLSYWPSRSGWTSPWLTAFVVEIMDMAKAAKYDVNDRVYSKALKYLLREMKRKDTGGRKGFIDSYTLLVTAKAGKPDRSELRKLYKEKDSLPISGRINVLKAMHAAGGFKKQVVALQKKLLSGLIEKDRLAYVASEESRGFEFCHESQVRLTALTLEALLETGSKSRFDEPMIRWLTEQRRFGRWRTTQENVAVFRAFSVYTNVYEKEAPKLVAAARIGGKEWYNALLEGREGAQSAQSAFARASKPLDSIPVKGETEVTVKRTGSGRLYYDLLLSSFPKGGVPPASRGLTVKRTLSKIGASTENTPMDQSRLRVGELIKVKLDIRCSQDITFAAVNDPIPAGCEAVNPDLSGGERTIAVETTHWSGPAGLSYKEFRDSRVLLFCDNLPAGEYCFTYLLKPTTAGKFLWPALFAEAMYYPEIFGRGEERVVRIEESR